VRPTYTPTVIGFATQERGTWPLLLSAGGTAVLIGLLAAATSPLVPFAALIGLAVVVAIVWRPIIGLLLFVAVVATLPFGVIPVRLAGAQLTFVDAILLTTFAAVLGQAVMHRRAVPLGASGAAVLAFVLIAVTAFVTGGASSGMPPELIRRFGKLIVGVLVFLVARALLIDEQRITRLTQALMIGGATQGLIGSGLMALPPLTQLTLLTRLQVIGYPSSDVLRYVPGANDTYTNQLRAIGTSVDPNVFGGTLMLALALIIVQWASPRPAMRRPALVLLALPTAAGLALSLSRASWLGLALGLGFIGAVRYRRILVLGLAAIGLVLITPRGQDLLLRFSSGFSIADRATAFRVGEYANALTLLQRYPFLGIGFGVSPDIDVTAGVSSVYLLVAEQTGLLGLSLFLVAVGLVWWAGARQLGQARNEQLQGLQAALVAALSGALIAGLLDHYFANQAFPHAVALFWLYAALLVATAELLSSANGQREPERAAQTWPRAGRPNGPAVQRHQVPSDR
jgi:O-antigen ligase